MPTTNPGKETKNVIRLPTVVEGHDGGLYKIGAQVTFRGTEPAADAGRGLPLSIAEEWGIPFVVLEELGYEVPALLFMQFVLRRISPPKEVQLGDGRTALLLVHEWDLFVPISTEETRARYEGLASQVFAGASDFQGARVPAVKSLTLVPEVATGLDEMIGQMMKDISKADPPIGATLHILYGMDSDGNDKVLVRGSATDHLRIERGEVKSENRHAWKVWKDSRLFGFYGAYAEFLALILSNNRKMAQKTYRLEVARSKTWGSSPVFAMISSIYALRLWCRAAFICPETLKAPPQIPDTDPWGDRDSKGYTYIQQVGTGMLRYFRSLWKSTFLTPELKRKLSAAGMNLRGVNATMLASVDDALVAAAMEAGFDKQNELAELLPPGIGRMNKPNGPTDESQ